MSERATREEIEEGLSSASEKMLTERERLAAVLLYAHTHNIGDEDAIRKILEKRMARTNYNIHELSKLEDDMRGPEYYTN